MVLGETPGGPRPGVMRRERRGGDVPHLDVVCTPEPPVTPDVPEHERPVPGSVMWVPASAGLLMAQHIVRKLIDQ